MGRLLGLLFGFMVGHIPGAMLGFWLGMRFDAALARQAAGGVTSPHRSDTQYFLKTTFQMMGYIAKATGRITENDVRAARRLMAELRLDPAQTQQAMQNFNIGKQLNFPWHATICAFCATVPLSSGVRHQWLQIQMRIAVESGMTPSKHRCLERIAAELGIPLPRAEPPPAQASSPDALAQAYRTFGLEPTASDVEVKKAYRQQMQRHHPDRLAGRGLSAAALERAKEKTQQIQSAYQEIQKARKQD